MRKDIRNGIADKNKKGLANDKGNGGDKEKPKREKTLTVEKTGRQG